MIRILVSVKAPKFVTGLGISGFLVLIVLVNFQ